MQKVLVESFLFLPLVLDSPPLSSISDDDVEEGHAACLQLANVHGLFILLPKARE